jgi:hypothetical protein
MPSQVRSPSGQLVVQTSESRRDVQHTVMGEFVFNQNVQCSAAESDAASSIVEQVAPDPTCRSIGAPVTLRLLYHHHCYRHCYCYCYYRFFLQVRFGCKDFATEADAHSACTLACRDSLRAANASKCVLSGPDPAVLRTANIDTSPSMPKLTRHSARMHEAPTAWQSLGDPLWH